MELHSAIKLLLINNQYVSIPTLGSFVVVHQPASLSPDGKTFMPPTEIISFDAKRTFNDEALERFLVEHQNMDKEDAQKAVEQFADNTKNSLQSGQQVYFEGVGMLKKGADGNIFFEPESNEKRIASTFGLKEVPVAPRKEAHQKPVPTTPTPKKAYPKKRSSTALIVGLGIGFIVIAVAVALYLFYPISQYWNREPIAVNQPHTDTHQEIIHLDTLENSSNDTTSLGTEAPLETIIPEIGVETDKKTALYYSEPVAQESRTYYIISGSFARMENAQVHLRNLEKKGYKPEILESNGSYRVAMLKYTDKNRALRELDRLRREKPYQSVWLLGL